MKSQDDYIYTETQWEQIEGPFTFQQNKWVRSLVKRASFIRWLFFRPNARLRERIFEYPLTIAGLSSLPKPARIADVGGASSLLPLEMVYLGHEVHVFDLRPYPISHPRLFVHQMDIFDNNIGDNFFDALSCISVIEHAGLPRYGGRPRPDADLAMMQEFRRLVRPHGRVFLSAPYGQRHDPSTDNPPLGYRIYNCRRLELLLSGFHPESLRFFAIEQGCWLEKSRAEADDTLAARPAKTVFFASLSVEK